VLASVWEWSCRCWSWRAEQCEYSQLGVATSGVTLFRSIGERCVAMFGAVFAHGLQEQLASCAARLCGFRPASPDALQALPPRCRSLCHRHRCPLQPVFLVAAAIGPSASLLTSGLREIPLRGMEPAKDLSEGFLMRARPHAGGAGTHRHQAVGT